ncbi:regulator of Vps4 activity in the MVB pathway-domain-containing protein [Melampsora americana]|nr:regulator of Vps4 activity in the MVB pathway-domain-containing protein [Melampsora americana]
MSPFNLARCKVQVKLSLQRLRMVIEKMEASAKVSRREIATLIEKGKIETARIRVETIISDDVHIELLEILELYCEILSARVNLIECSSVVDPGISDSVASIIHAAPRTEVKELHQLREILMNRYGRDYTISVMENRDNLIPSRITSKLNLSTPSIKLVEMYLNEIAKAYNLSIPFQEFQELQSISLNPIQLEPLSSSIDSNLSKPKPRRRTVSFKELESDSSTGILQGSSSSNAQPELTDSKVITPPDREIPKRDMNHSGGSTVRSFSTAHSRASTFADVPEESNEHQSGSVTHHLTEERDPEVEQMVKNTQRFVERERERDVNFDELSQRLAALKGLK